MISYNQKLWSPKDRENSYSTGFINYPFQTLEDIIGITCLHRWTPFVFKDGHRCGENFISTDIFVLDFDDPEPSLEQIVKLFCDTTHIIGTTQNHMRYKENKGCHNRFRLIALAERKITRFDEYKFNILRLINEYGSDRTCSDLGRSYKPFREIVSYNFDGYTEPVKKESPMLRLKRETLFKKKYGKKKDWLTEETKSFLSDGIVFGDGRHDAILKVATDLHQCGKSASEIEAAIKAAPFDRRGFEIHDIPRLVRDSGRFIEGVRNGSRNKGQCY